MEALYLLLLVNTARKTVYFSDTGTVPPESCIFGQLLNITAVLSKFFDSVSSNPNFSFS